MRKILLFLLIPLIITDDAEMLIVKSTINSGIDAIRQFVPENQTIAGFLPPFFDAIFDMGQPDPNAVILERLNVLRDEIMSRLDRIENELKILNNNILNEIRGTIYISGLGYELNQLKARIEALVSTLNMIIDSKRYSNNEKIVEIVYLIGKHQEWMGEGNIVFNLKQLADILAGNFFSWTEQRDLYQFVYDSCIFNRMFSGEAYDDSDIYIEKVINIYFYGCSAIFQSLRNAQLMYNFTEKDIESLSPLVKNHFYSVVVNPNIVTTQMKSIADKVFDLKNKDSVVSHYLAFKYKKKFCRNIFINLGKTTPVPISNRIDIKEFSYTYYNASCDLNLHETVIQYNEVLRKIKSETQKLEDDVNDFLNPNITAISARQMYELYDYFLKTYKNNTRFEFLRFLLDKGIDVNELFDETYEMNFFVHDFKDNIDLGYKKVSYNEIFDDWYYFNLLHSDGIQNLTNNKSIIVRDFIPLYVELIGGVSRNHPTVYGIPQGKRKVTRLLLGNTIIVPSTAEEIINSNDTIKYDNSTSMIFTGINFSDNYIDLQTPQIITLGFSNYINNNANYTYNETFFRYNIHFIYLNKNIKSLIMIHSVNIKYKTKLRNLYYENIFSTCIMNTITKNKKFKASCFIPKNDSEIDNIEVIPDFDFISEDNITIKMSSLANKQKNNINNLENIDYSSYNIYILENSSIIKNENLLFSINGIINENITIINNTDLILFLNNNKNGTCEVKCKIINILDNNYTLNCESNETYNANLDSSISIINNNSILLLTFNDSESNIELERIIKTRHYFRKNDKALGAGSIALIVIIPIIAIISVIAIICFTKKDNKNNINENTTIGSVDVLNK